MALDDKNPPGDGKGTGPDGKIVDLAEARKRQRTVFSRGDKKERAGGSKGYDQALAKQRDKKGGGSGQPMPMKKKLLAYVQLVIFLAVVAYMMHMCQGGGV